MLVIVEKNIYEEKRILEVLHRIFEKKTHPTKSLWKMPKDNCDSGVHLMLVAHADS